jgi:phosphohistidine phosphatase SixA
MSLIFHKFGVLAVGCFLASATVWAQTPAAVPVFVEKLATRKLVDEVRQGGFVLYMRHGNTDNSRPDAVPQVDLNDCTTQRPLSAEGRQVAARVGQYLRQAQIPVAEVIHSPMCRARDSAHLAFPNFGDKLRPEPRLTYTSNLTTEEKKPVLAKTRELVSTPVAAGTNRVLVAHAPNMADLMGYFVKPEATVVVIRPLGDGRFEYLASIHPDMWPQLLK